MRIYDLIAKKRDGGTHTRAVEFYAILSLLASMLMIINISK